MGYPLKIMKRMSVQDVTVKRIIHKEKERQNRTINLIASENYAPACVLDALGSVFTDKYSEGYIGKRYYPGVSHCDRIEQLATQRALKAFKLSEKKWAVNVQAYSGAIANMAVYLALGVPKDTILSLSLSSGGHLSHGAAVSFTGKLFNVVHYGVDTSYNINYAELEKQARAHRPVIIVSGASAFAKKIDFKKIGAIAKRVGAYHLADISHYAGLITAGEYPSPFPYADVVMSTTHKSLCGPRGALIFAKKQSFIGRKNALDIPQAINHALFPGLQGGPHNNVIAAIACGLLLVSRPRFKRLMKQTLHNARSFAKALSGEKLFVVGKTTDSHIVLVQTERVGVSGEKAQQALELVGIVANKNMIASDTKPHHPSAIRFGVYAVSARGMKEGEMKLIARLIADVLYHRRSLVAIKRDVLALCKKFPAYN